MIRLLTTKDLAMITGGNEICCPEMYKGSSFSMASLLTHKSNEGAISCFYADGSEPGPALKPGAVVGRGNWEKSQDGASEGYEVWDCWSSPCCVDGSYLAPGSHEDL